MRNEIFKQISQNKIQYYSELKNNQKEQLPKMDSLRNQRIYRKENASIPETKYLFTHRLSKFNYSKLISILSPIHVQISNITSRSTHWLKGINEYISRKTTIQSKRITDSLSKVSSQLFEDSYEFNQNPELTTKLERLKDHQTTAYGLIDYSGSAIAIPYQKDGYGLLDQFINWLFKMYRNMILFLEADNWFEEIRHSQNSSKLPEVQNITHDNTSKLRKFEFLYKSIVSSRIENDKVVSENVI